MTYSRRRRAQSEEMPGLSLLDPSSLRSKAAALNQVSTVLRGNQGAGGLGYFLLRLGVLKPGARPLAGHPGDRHVGAPWSGVKEAEEAPRAAAPGLGLEDGAVVPRWKPAPNCGETERPASDRPHRAPPRKRRSPLSPQNSRQRVTCRPALQEVVLGSNKSRPRLPSKPIRTRSRGPAGLPRQVGTRDSGGRDLLGG